MTWIAVCDFERPVFNLNGVDAPITAQSTNDAVLAKGTLLLEAIVTPSKQDHVLLDYRCHGHWPFRINIQKATNGTFWVYIEQGTANDHIHAIETDLAHFSGTVQLSFCWDGPKRIGHLSISVPQTGDVYQTQLHAPCPLPLEAVCNMTLVHAGQVFTQGTTFFAIANHVEPTGIAATLPQNSYIKTPSGHRHLETLHQGMTVSCQRYGPQMVDWVSHHTRPACGSALPIRLCAPFLGLKQDVIVAANQRVAIGGPDVEYLFGEETVLVQARDLIHGPMAMIETGYRTITYSQIYLERHALINVNGCDMETLFLTKSTQDALSILTPQNPLHDLTNLPIHTYPARPTLRGFEAMTLNKVLVA
jgi:hypothetical protein